MSRSYRAEKKLKRQRRLSPYRRAKVRLDTIILE